MTTLSCADNFWTALDTLIVDSQIIIDRPRGSRHPKFEHIIYPLDYGYLKNTSLMDGSGIDLWRGTGNDATLDAIIVTVDLMKRDSEIKLLLGVSEDEKSIIHDFHNNSIYMKGIIINRPAEDP